LDWADPGFRGDSLEGSQLYRYFKLSNDFRYYLPAGRKSSWAFRVNIGIARPYGQSTVLPYERFFFVGGSNSIRAWPPRRLGPGSDPDVMDSTRNDGTIDYGRNYQFEQPGDILLETSAEYRFDIVSFLEGAVFVDAGNVWVWKSQLNQPEGQFRWNRFYKEIAVGTGFGLRLDFSFLILRFDVGIKAYDPGKPAGQKFMLKNLSFNRPFGERQQTVLNVGIGYPF
jgi:outer membrane protein insertion porin family